jgi:nucleoside-diphosphate-sugar epimerase
VGNCGQIKERKMSFVSKKIFVVGGAGYIGSILVQELLEKGFAVKVFDRLYFGDQGLRELHDKIELIVGDMRTMDPAVLDDVEVVINLGGLSNDPTAEFNPKANYEMNTIATGNLAQICKERGVKRYIFASSCSVYYVKAGVEGEDFLISEDAKLNPKAAYSSSKYEAEKILLSMVDDHFSPVILRKGTVFGFSPRMRYDLVVNTFMRYALDKGYIPLHYGGEMWRPLIEVRDVARAYIACIEAEDEQIKGQIFNIATKNYRISELALQVREVLRDFGLNIDIRCDYKYKGVRSYRVSTEKIYKALGFRPTIGLAESIKVMMDCIDTYKYNDFDNPIYYNIKWIKLLEEAKDIINITGSVL